MTKSEILLMSADDYMSGSQLQFFRELINTRISELRLRIGDWREELERLENVPDPGDAATIEEQRQKVTSSIRRDSSALSELVEALTRIDEGTYGYCETGPEIGLRRLLVLPRPNFALKSRSAVRPATAIARNLQPEVCGGGTSTVVCSTPASGIVKS